MGAKIYDKDCMGCKYSQEIQKPRGGIVKLDRHWILNHYAGPEGFLGWVALQPRYHRMELTDLNTDEANALGRNIENIDRALREYWAIKFPGDLVRRVYVVYFFESAFEKTQNQYHLHFHLIPRTEKFRSLSKCGSTLIGWDIHRLSKHKDFPPEYQIRETDYQTEERNKENRQKVEEFMTYLRGQLESPS